MRKWGLLVAGLYGALVILLINPVLKLFYLGTEAGKSMSWNPFALTHNWSTLAGLFVCLMLAQGLLLCVPVAMAENRPVTRRPVRATIIAAALAIAILVAGFSCVLFEALQGTIEGNVWGKVAGFVFLLTWAFWAIVFLGWARLQKPSVFVDKITRALFQGSILQLLVAVPTHIFVRQREYCCAGVLTFYGIAAGLAVMLFSFGPGVFFLFAARGKRLHPHKTP